MKRELTLVTPAATYPVTVAALKDHLIIDQSYTDQDSRLTDLIAAAVEYAEEATNRAYVSQTWRVDLPQFPWACNGTYYAMQPSPWGYGHSFHKQRQRRDRIDLPRPPLVSVTWVKYYDAANALQTLVANTDYRVINAGRGVSWVEPINAWPSTFFRSDAVQVQYVSGAYTPARLKHAVKVIAGALNNFREGEIVGSSKLTEFGIDRLLDQLRTGEYF